MQYSVKKTHTHSHTLPCVDQMYLSLGFEQVLCLPPLTPPPSPDKHTLATKTSPGSLPMVEVLLRLIAYPFKAARCCHTPSWRILWSD